MELRFIILFVIFANFLFAYQISDTNITDEGFYFRKVVRVLSGKTLTPIPNAEVRVRFQRNSQMGFITSNPYTTDENGQTQILVINNEPDASKINKEYSVIASYLGAESTVSYEYGSDPNSIDVILDSIQPFTIFLKDIYNNPVPNAEVILKENNQHYATNGAGSVVLFLPKGIFNIDVIYKNITFHKQIDSSYGDSQNIDLEDYSFYTIVKDSSGNNLAGVKVQVNNETKISDESGKVLSFLHIPNRLVNTTYSYSGLRISKTIDLKDVEVPYTFYFDKTAPLIKNLKTNISNDVLVVSFNLMDPGDYSSGLDISNVNVQYSINNGPYYTSMVYNLEKNGKRLFISEISDLPEGSEIGLRIIAKDNFGNSITFTAITHMPEKPIIIDQDQDIDQEDQQDNETEKDDPLLFAMIVGGGLLLVFVLGSFIYKKISEERDE